MFIGKILVELNRSAVMTGYALTRHAGACNEISVRILERTCREEVDNQEDGIYIAEQAGSHSLKVAMRNKRCNLSCSRMRV